MARRIPPGANDKVRTLMAPYLSPDEMMLATIGRTLADKRDKAVEARKTAGIEQIWFEAERAYAGIDDANAHLHQGTRWQKPMDINGPLTNASARGQGRDEPLKSSLFVPITERYTNAGWAKVTEILLPTDEKAFGIEETPVPSWLDLKDDKSQVVSPTLGVPLTRPATPEEIAAGQQPAPVPGLPAAGAPAAVPAPAGGSGGGPLAGVAGAVMPGAPQAPQTPPGEVPLTHADLAKEQIDKAHKKAEKAENRLQDWLVEADYAGEASKIIFDSTRLGVGVLKGPFPWERTNRAVQTLKEGIAFIEETVIAPKEKWVDAWNAFPDPHCGENVAHGSFFFERDFLTEADVEALKDQPGYISAQIEKALKEGPSKANLADEDQRPALLKKTDGRYEIWHFTGRLKREELDCICQAAGKPLRSDEARGTMPSVVVSFINDTVIRAAPNPLESGALGYYSMPWGRRVGSWVGKGVPEQMQAAQKWVNAGVRRLLDNAGLAAGSQIVMDPIMIEPADNNRQITPNKIWNRTADGQGVPIEQIFATFDIPIRTDEILKIIELGLRFAEESTSIPLVTQGQSGVTTPDTYGGMLLQNNNANQLLRSLARTYDTNIIKPFIGELYQWLLLDPDVPNDEKGDFRIIARGSAVLVERAIAEAAIASHAPFIKDPAFGGNPRRWYASLLRAQRLDPREIMNTPEEQEKADALAAQVPQMPQIQVAQIRAQTDQQRIAAEAQENEADRQLRAIEVKTQATIDLSELEQKRELALLEYANRNNETLAQVQAKLADTTMKLRTQEKLSNQRMQGNGRRGGPQVASPPTEPAGRAPPGRAFDA